MAIDIITGFNSASAESLDKRSGPYTSLAAAISALPASNRFVGLKVLVVDSATQDTAGNFTGGNLTEYVFEGGIADANLVEVVTLKSDFDTSLANKPSSADIDNIVTLDQAAYTALSPKDSRTLYIIT